MDAAINSAFAISESELALIDLYRSCSQDCRQTILDYAAAAAAHTKVDECAGEIIPFPCKV